MPEPKSWKKILYEDQGYPDDYTDKTFLKDLRKNVKIEEITLTEAILGATCLIQELCTVVFLTLVYVHLYNDWIHPDVVMISSNIIVLLGFLLYNKTINLAKALIFIGLVCPILFIRYQSYKQNIYGPWDEAIIDNAVHINDLIYS
ncbi:Phosphatidylinositol N-acetylglucosaminyltransferase [Popillia japonica]|uniref:Phosphatidylinositol N-acetylglucosaminyltransferase n=1 Tax=Popillia japonica TaxID=7064 RepID=A0AAW1HSE6_POPJA